MGHIVDKVARVYMGVSCAILSIPGEYYRTNSIGESVEVEVFRNTVIGSEQDWNDADGIVSDIYIGYWILEYREIASRLLNAFRGSDNK